MRLQAYARRSERLPTRPSSRAGGRTFQSKVGAMKKAKVLTVAFSIFLIGCAGPARHAKFRSEPDGFRGIRWGTEISALGEMEKVEQNKPSNSDLTWYIRKTDVLAIGKAELESIFYSFWMGSFEGVWIDFKGDENFETLKKELFERFGKARESERSMEKMGKGTQREQLTRELLGAFYAWWGEKTDIFLSYSQDRHKGTLTMSSKKVREERRDYEKEKEKEKRIKERGF